MVYFLVLLVALLFSGCGGSAPTSDASTPVAVELPNITDVPYITSTVVSSSSSISSPLKESLWMQVTKAVGTSGNPFTPVTSLLACKTTNQFRSLLKGAMDSDFVTCLVKEQFAPEASNKGINLYDGNYHDASFTGLDTSYYNVRTKVVRGSDGSVNSMEVFACLSGQQTHYVRMAIDNGAMQYSSKDVAASGKYDVSLSGTLDSSGRYTSKAVTVAESGSDYRTKGTMSQGAASAVLDTFRVGTDSGGTETDRVYSSFDLSYAGSDSPFDPRQYQMGSGAGRLIYRESLDQTECWNGDTLKVDSGSCGSNLSAVQGKTPRSVEDVSISISGSETVDCSAISPAFSVAYDTSDTACGRFRLNNSEIDCFASALGDFSVTASYNGSTLSTSSSSPTTVSTSPQILLTASYMAATDTFHSGTIILEPCSSGSCAIDYNSNLITNSTVSNWNSAHTVLTLSPSLTSGQTYQLTLDGGNGLSGIGNTNNKMPSDVVYYLRAQ